jgi:Sulfatase
MTTEKDRDDRKENVPNRRSILLGGTTLAAAAIAAGSASTVSQIKAQPAATAGRKPNILFIMGDDIGWFNVSAYNMGVMGYRTPNIDRIGREGAIFTDWYGQQSCTAGRAAFITGQSPIRTGLTKVGVPGAELGLGPLDPSVGDVLKTYGYATGQFGKNHLGDRNEHLPTMHGFDEFFGNLYHLNAEEEPQNPDYPKDPRFKARFGPRGVLKCRVSDRDDLTVDPVFGRVGKQVIENTGLSTPSAWRPSTKNSSPQPKISSIANTAQESLGSVISTVRGCMSLRISKRHRRARPASAFTRTAWWRLTDMSASC